jgi:hypothetical protein
MTLDGLVPESNNYDSNYIVMSGLEH